MPLYWAKNYKGTEAELTIEPAIAALGIVYRNQFPLHLYGLGKYFPDFLLPTIGVVLEVDDDSHNNPENKEADAQRTSALEKLGYVVVRCTNDEAKFQPRETVQRLIVESGLLNRKGPGLPATSSRKTKTKKKKPLKASRPKSPRSLLQPDTCN